MYALGPYAALPYTDVILHQAIATRTPRNHGMIFGQLNPSILVMMALAVRTLQNREVARRDILTAKWWLP